MSDKYLFTNSLADFHSSVKAVILALCDKHKDAEGVPFEDLKAAFGVDPKSDGVEIKISSSDSSKKEKKTPAKKSGGGRKSDSKGTCAYKINEGKSNERTCDKGAKQELEGQLLCTTHFKSVEKRLAKAKDGKKEKKSKSSKEKKTFKPKNAEDDDEDPGTLTMKVNEAGYPMDKEGRVAVQDEEKYKNFEYRGQEDDDIAFIARWDKKAKKLIPLTDEDIAKIKDEAFNVIAKEDRDAYIKAENEKLAVKKS